MDKKNLEEAIINMNCWLNKKSGNFPESPAATLVNFVKQSFRYTPTSIINMLKPSNFFPIIILSNNFYYVSDIIMKDLDIKRWHYADFKNLATFIKNNINFEDLKNRSIDNPTFVEYSKTNYENNLNNIIESLKTFK